MVKIEEFLKSYKSQCDKVFIDETKNKEEIKYISFKRSKFYNNNYIHCTWTGNSMAGTILNSCSFEDTSICDSGFTSCNLNKIDFYANDLLTYAGNNFSNSMFMACNWKNIKIYGSAIIDSIFESNAFENCVFKSVTLESTIFKNCSFVNVNFSESNIEFADYSTCNFKDVTFSILQFPYIFGITDIIKNKEVKFSDKKEINLETYLELLPQLKENFLVKGEYFPVCNILICLHKEQEALEYLRLGIQKEIENNNYRMISFYCKLGLKYDLIDSKFAYQIMDYIDNHIIKNDLSEMQLKNLLLYSSKIRNQLMNFSENKLNLQFTISTNIPSTDNKTISELLELINIFLNKDVIGDNKNYIEIRHNSPFQLFVSIIQNSAAIITISEAFIALIKLYLKYKRNHKTINISSLIDKTISQTNLKLERDFKKKLVVQNREDKKKNIKNIIEKYSAQIKLISEKNKKNKDQLIDSITQKIIGEIDEELPQNLYIFKVEDLEED